MQIKLSRFKFPWKIDNWFTKRCLSTRVSMLTPTNSLKEACVYITATRRNVFCTVMNASTRRIETSCSIRVPKYENKYNQRENLFKRGVILGQLIGEKLLGFGYTQVGLCLNSGPNRSRNGVIRGFSRTKLQICSIKITKGYPHNGCRPAKVRRKKIRTKTLK